MAIRSVANTQAGNRTVFFDPNAVTSASIVEPSVTDGTHWFVYLDVPEPGGTPYLALLFDTEAEAQDFVNSIL